MSEEMENKLVEQEGIDYVICLVCGKKFKGISNTHLKHHNLTPEEYKKKYPDSKMICDKSTQQRLQKIEGKTYEEIYGEEKAEQLRAIRSEATRRSFEVSERRQKNIDAHTGKVLSEETKMRIAEGHAIFPLSKLRIELYKKYGKKCQICGCDENDKKLVIHHKNYDHYPESIDDVMIVCRSCHTKLHNAQRKTDEDITTKINTIKRATSDILRAIVPGKYLEYDEHFADTPRRVAGAYKELCGIGLDVNKEIEEVIELFDNTSDELILVNTRAVTLCPHHLMTVELDIKIGIVPDKYLVGISKFQRISELLAKQPIIQEEYTNILADNLMKWIIPKGVICVVEGRHNCMRERGIKEPDAKMITSAVRGIFAVDHSLKMEFFELLKNNF